MKKCPKCGKVLTTKDYVQEILNLFNRQNSKQGIYYEWLILRGDHFNMDGVPPKRITFTPKKSACYYNAQMFAIENKDAQYYEGFAMSRHLDGISFEHAFIVMNGKVIDPTWTDGHDYFGVHIPTSFIRGRIIKDKYAQSLLNFYYMEVNFHES